VAVSGAFGDDIDGVETGLSDNDVIDYPCARSNVVENLGHAARYLLKLMPNRDVRVLQEPDLSHCEDRTEQLVEGETYSQNEEDEQQVELPMGITDVQLLRL
jgi:hypothetical protein